MFDYHRDPDAYGRKEIVAIWLVVGMTVFWTVVNIPDLMASLREAWVTLFMFLFLSGLTIALAGFGVVFE